MKNYNLKSNSEKLWYFYEVAISGSLQDAATKLRKSQPTLSYTIKDLETKLGTQLFKRSKSGMELNEDGEKLFLFCKKFFRELDTIEDNLTKSLVDEKVKVIFGTFPSIASYLWPKVLDSLSINKNISLSLITNRSYTIEQELIKRTIDFTITVEHQNHPQIESIEIYTDQYAFFAHKDLLFESDKKKNYSWEQIKSLRLIFLPDAINKDGQTLKTFLHEKKLELNETLEIDSFDLALEFTLQKIGIAILPLRVATKHLNEIDILKINEIGSTFFGKHRFYLSYHKESNVSQKIAKTVIETVKEIIQRDNYLLKIPQIK